MVWQDVPSSSLLMTVQMVEDRSCCSLLLLPVTQLYLAMLLPLTTHLQWLKARELRLAARGDTT
jgi:hypothetical protein